MKSFERLPPSGGPYAGGVEPASGGLTGVASRDAIAINKGKDEVWCKQIDVVVGWRRIRVNFGCRNGVRVAFLSFGEVIVL